MMFFERVLRLPLAFAAVALAQTQYLAPDLSFGHEGRISPNGRGIPNFYLTGEPAPPELLSNKIILTPIEPGNSRGAIWAEKQLQHSEWTADVEFRATGPERGGGKLQIWLVKDGKDAIGTSSIYTSSKFEGLGLVLDTYGGSAGTLRGFLNDGLTEYASHHSVDSLAFGHCSFPYRNLGRPAQIKIRQTLQNFKVEIDGHTCFESSNIRLPNGYYFGISAASAELPDSFEIFKFVVTTDDHEPDHERDYREFRERQQQVQESPQNPGDGEGSNDNQGEGQGEEQWQSEQVPEVKEVPAEQIDQSKQFADLHNRLQQIQKHISVLQRDISHFQTDNFGHLRKIHDKPCPSFPSVDQINVMDRRIEAIERSVGTIAKDVRDVRDNKGGAGNGVGGAGANGGEDMREVRRLFEELQRTMRSNHQSLHQSVTEGVRGTVQDVVKGHTAGFWWFVGTVVGAQGVLAGAYVWYKKRRAMAPKKYL